MYTEYRLTQAYKKAKVKYFDKDSKYVFFSDLHRGDDSPSDRFARNQAVFLAALNYYYDNGYTYVEVGDGDELWEYNEFRHIRLAHSDIFEAIQKFHYDKRFIMLYGNHNIYLRSKNYVKKHLYNYYDEYTQDIHDLLKEIKPCESLLLKEKESGQEILVVHGHQGDLMNDRLWFINMLLVRYFWRFMHVVGFQNPSSPARNHFKRHKVERNYKRWIAKHKLMLICGHTHRAKYAKLTELPYFNTGSCVHTRGFNGIEIVGNKIMLIDWRVRPNDEGVLEVVRSVMRGPIPISKFDLKRKVRLTN